MSEVRDWDHEDDCYPEGDIEGAWDPEDDCPECDGTGEVCAEDGVIRCETCSGNGWLPFPPVHG